MKKSKSSASKVVVKAREDNFRIPPISGIPEYHAENDRNCPRAQVKKFNLDKKLKAKEAEESTKNTHTWIDNVLKSKHSHVPVTLRPTLRQQAVGAALGNKDSLAEVEILQKIIVRENLLSELEKLLKNQNDIYSCLGEITELVKALRFQTVDIIEDIEAWQCVQLNPRSFLYRGVNYVVKILRDLDFLDQYEEIIERFCFEFIGNPLAYRGGGEIINLQSTFAKSVTRTSNKVTATLNRHSSYLTSDKGSVDGVEVARLRNAEKFIQKELDRLEGEKTLLRQFEEISNHGSVDDKTLYRPYPQLNQSELTGGVARKKEEEGNPSTSYTVGTSQVMNGSSVMSKHKSSSVAMKMKENGANKNSISILSSILESPGGPMKLKFNPKKVKVERIRVLNEEVNELRSMEAYIEDQVEVLVTNYRGLNDKKKSLELKKKDAISSGREAAVQHYSVEISVVTAEMQDANLKIKDLQRQTYFITLEKKRKILISQKLQQEIKDDQRKAELEQKIKYKIKEGGLLAALKTLNQVSMMNMSQISDGFNGSGNVHALAGSAKSKSPTRKVIITEDILLKTLDNNSSMPLEHAAVNEDVTNDENTFGTNYDLNEDTIDLDQPSYFQDLGNNESYISGDENDFDPNEYDKGTVLPPSSAGYSFDVAADLDDDENKDEDYWEHKYQHHNEGDDDVINNDPLIEIERSERQRIEKEIDQRLEKLYSGMTLDQPLLTSDSLHLPLDDITPVGTGFAFASARKGGGGASVEISGIGSTSLDDDTDNENEIVADSQSCECLHVDARHAF